MAYLFLVLGALFFLFIWFGFLDDDHASIRTLNPGRLLGNNSSLPSKSQFYVQGTWKLEKEVWEHLQANLKPGHLVQLFAGAAPKKVDVIWEQQKIGEVPSTYYLRRQLYQIIQEHGTFNARFKELKVKGSNRRQMYVMVEVEFNK
jgi:hypothetical protein